MKQRVLLVATVYTHLANFHKPTIKLLQDKGFEVHAAANDNEGRKDEIEEMGVVCHTILFSRSPLNMNNILAMKGLSVLFKTNIYKVIHVHTPIAAFIVRMISSFYKQGPVLYTAHGFHFHKNAPLINWLIYYPAEKIAKRWTDGLIVVNDEDFTMAKKMGYVPNKTLFLTHGVGVNLNLHKQNDESIGNIREELAIPQEDFVLVCVAEFTKNKNHRFLLQAWQRLLQVSTDCHLILAGSGKFYSRMKTYTLQKKINNVHFLGFRHDVQEILKHSDAITLVSKREGLPKSIMEGMVLGLPAIVTNIRGSKDLITHEENGFVVNLGHVDDLTHFMKLLIDNKQIRSKMGQYSIGKIKTYSTTNVIKELENIYQRFRVIR
ncbi:glycosyltransferase family 4 protein [Bacillus salinus]|uniref:glycosyltransferase family 4 protein n=1 Tax=Bacillus sp. HMF5848 TaxID=2495421 RepID=UPI0021AD5E2E|nr:glycosyltransferase family 4 protein [Bacillus sp. HMF5848]